MINQHELAIKISKAEGKKKEVNIGQIKEVLRIGLNILARDYRMSDVVRLIEKHGFRR